MHGGGKAGLFAQLKLDMIMVGHQHIAVHPYAETAREFPEPLQKIRVISAVAKDDATLMTSIDDVIPSLRNLQPS